MKAIKRIIAWICQKIVGKVRWLNFLVRVGNIPKDAYYNHLTEMVMERVLKPESTCIDIGCYRGEILERMMQYARRGRFLAFEPLPDHYNELVRKFPFENVRLYNLALSDSAGTSSFNYVVSNPAYSGLKKRPYGRPHEEERQIEVSTERLDSILKAASVDSVDFIKIDVEGGEYDVLKGAIDCIRQNQPIIIFEHGLQAAQAYGTTPQDLYQLLCTQCGLRISLLQDWLLNKPPLTQSLFCRQVYEKRNYYFMAHR